MSEGVIVKALSGFYYVRSQEETVRCRARGIFRKEGMSPLVGDRVEFTKNCDGSGTIDSVRARRNHFIRPAVANVDQLIIMASPVIPVTDPYLIDRVCAIAERAGCEPVICINKTDADPGDGLWNIYSGTGYRVLRTSAVTGTGIDELGQVLAGKISAFTGNSGVGKSSVLNALSPELGVQVGEVSEKLGRGRHTTRHVELFDLGGDTYVADTPGFASFDTEMVEPIPKDELQYVFGEFGQYIGKCRFSDCVHLKEPGCAVLEAVAEGRIHVSRHASYARMYEQAAKIKDWEIK